MSPVGDGLLSLTKFYQLRELVTELAQVAPGVTEAQVRDLLGGARTELADDLVLYESGVAVDDPLLQACRSGSASALPLIWVALVMADTRLAGIVEDHLTDGDGKLIAGRFDTEGLETEVGRVLAAGRRTRKPATNILSYLRDAGLVEPITHGNTIVGIDRTPDTAPVVRDAVRYILFRLQHFGEAYPDDLDDVGVALDFKANHWLNLTPDEFRAAYEATPADVVIEAPQPEPRPGEPPPGEPPPIATEVDVEAHNTESYEVSGQTTRTAVRREQPLVIAYKAWMADRGSEIVRLKFRPPSTPAHLFNDIYDKTRNNLIEGKADATRPSIRMAIGQLMDYRRFAPEGARLAVLTELRPRGDLEDLLLTLGIACVWTADDAFVDNADGVFV